MHARSLALAVALLAPAPLPAGKQQDASPAAEKPLHVFRGTLDAKDPPDLRLKKSPHKVHEVQLEAGKWYQIDLQSKDFDAFLRLEDAKGKHLTGDDDSGGGTDARVVVRPARGGTFRVVVTTYPGARMSGAYTLSVRPAGARTERERQVLALNAAGEEHHQRGEQDEAGRLYRQALDLCRQLYPKGDYPHGHLNLALTLNNLGVSLQEVGEYEQARACFDEALAIRARALPPDHPILATSLNNLGALLRRLGKGEEARGHLERAHAIYKKALPPDHPHLAQSGNNLGLLLADLGKLADARACHEEALAVCKKGLGADHPLVATTLGNLGAVLIRLRKRAEALDCYERALAVVKKSRPPHHPDLANSLHNLGTLLHYLGKLEAARGYLEQALAIRTKALPADHSLPAVTRNNLGMVLWGLGKWEEAHGAVEQSLAILKKALPADHPHLVTGLHNLGVLRWSAGRHDEGWPLLSGAVAASASYRRRLAVAAAGRDHLDLVGTQAFLLDALLSAAVSSPRLAQGRGDELLLRLLESKGIGAAALGSRRDALLRQADPESRALAGRLLPLQRRLADLLLRGAGRLTLPQYREECAALRGQIDGMERELGRRVQAFALMQQAHTAAPRDLARRLSAGAVLIETVRYRAIQLGDGGAGRRWGPARYAAVLLWPGASGAEVRLVPLGEADALERAVAAWRAAVQRGRADDTAERALRELLWDPLAKALPENTKRLVVAPDGQLALLPLEAIRLDGGKYLIERYTVHYVSTGRDLMPGPLPEGRSDVALLVADPEYDATGGGAARGGARPGEADLHFKRLPGFAREADAAAKLLGARAGWRVERPDRSAAGEEALGKVPRPRLLYCITHGFFLEDVRRDPDAERLRDLDLIGGAGPRLPNFGEDPRLRSGLALAGANKWQERSAKGLSDGLLTALEVESLDLWGTELVVLSACDTGRGEVQVGEGVLGLRRAFQLAGAQTVLASLWKVPDAETEQLMSDTLSRWLKGAPPHEALREAQLGMIRRLRLAGARNDKQEAPPLYWAGFVCHGAAR